jgi:hypothetical protein
MLVRHITKIVIGSSPISAASEANGEVSIGGSDANYALTLNCVNIKGGHWNATGAILNPIPSISSRWIL